MKRARSSSPGIPSPEPRRPVDRTADLTYENLREHNQIILPLSQFAVVDMTTERIGGLSVTPSTHSSQRSRSISPSRVSDAQYRAGHLRRANIFVDEDTPMDVRVYAIDIFTSMTDENSETLQRVADKLWRKCKELVRRPSEEAEWTGALHTAIDELRPPGLEIVRNRDWSGDLKPPVYNPRSTIPRKRSQPHQLIQDDAHINNTNVAGPTVPIFKLKDPHPDICVGLSDESLTNALERTKGRGAARSFLFDLQDTSTLISDPHATPLSLRFPFLVVEAKSGATGGNLYQAQNQAAVSGSSALRIFQSLSDLHAQRLDTEAQASLNLAVSITTEGPIQEFWLHFQRHKEEDFYMVCIGSSRTTLKDSSLEFVRRLSAVLRWGDSILRERILGMLEEI